MKLTGKMYESERWVTFAVDQVVEIDDDWWIILKNDADIAAIDIDTIKPASRPCPHCRAMG